MKKNELFLSIIIPVYNEEKRIHNLKEVISYIVSLPFNAELIVVDDGSTDRTRKIINKFSKHKLINTISYKKNMGKGYAIRQGMLQAVGKYRLFIDVDLSTPVQELEKFYPFFPKYDVLIASRKVSEAKVIVHQSIVREIMGRLFTSLSRIILGVDVKDFTCGFKCFHNVAAKKIFTKTYINRWGFDSEILYLAKKYGYSIKEVPVRWENDPRTKVKFPQDVFRSLMELMLIRFYNFIGAYERKI